MSVASLPHLSPSTNVRLRLPTAKLAKYRAQLLEPDRKSGAKGEGFEVAKAGYGRVALIGFPSVGKSTLLSKLTGTESSVAAYEFVSWLRISWELSRVEKLTSSGFLIRQR